MYTRLEDGEYSGLVDIICNFMEKITVVDGEIVYPCDADDVVDNILDYLMLN